MTADLRVALAHGGTFLVAAGFQHSIFAVLVLDAQHGLLELFLLLQLPGVGEKVHLIEALVRRDLVGIDGDAPHRQRRVGDALKQLCAFVDEGTAQIGRGIKPDAGTWYGRLAGKCPDVDPGRKSYYSDSDLYPR